MRLIFAPFGADPGFSRRLSPVVEGSRHQRSGPQADGSVDIGRRYLEQRTHPGHCASTLQGWRHQSLEHSVAGQGVATAQDQSRDRRRNRSLAGGVYRLRNRGQTQQQRLALVGKSVGERPKKPRKKCSSAPSRIFQWFTSWRSWAKIIVIDIPVDKYREIGQHAGVIWAQLFQRAVEMAIHHVARRLRVAKRDVAVFGRRFNPVLNEWEKERLS